MRNLTIESLLVLIFFNFSPQIWLPEVKGSKDEGEGGQVPVELD